MDKDPKERRYERLVARQLRKSGLSPTPGDPAAQFVERVRATYAESEEQRRLNDHAFTIASAEMAVLNAELADKNQELEDALVSLMRSEQIEKLNTELSEKNEELSRLANTDSLTGLFNRYAFGRSLEALANSIDSAQYLAVAIIDLDRFKLVNDTFGHNVGDQLLVTVAKCLLASAENEDLVARLGGDEFAFARVVDSEAAADEFAKHVSSVLQKPVEIDHQQIHGGGSVGMSIRAGGDIDTVRMLRDADIAMYRAKENATKTYQMFDHQFRREVTRRYTLERELRASISNNDIRLVYQPIVSARSGRTVILEALSRWDSPSLGPIAPPEFIPVVERLGLTIEFGRSTLTNACQQLSQWREMYECGDVAVAVNFASPQLLGFDLIEFVLNTLKEYELDGNCLVIELTESDLLQDFDRAIRVLGKLRELGVRVALDDFGTGYSALAYLSRIPADYLKIDKTFVQSMETNMSDRRLTEVIVDLAERFGLEPIGEGIESQNQSSLLQEFGCDLLQGYMYGKPTEAFDLPSLCSWSETGKDTLRRAA